MSFDCKQLLIGGLIGAAAVTFIRTATFRKGCAKVLAAGLQLKDDAAEFLEGIKEDAEDVSAEAKQKQV